MYTSLTYLQKTRLHHILSRIPQKINHWAINPWRRISLLAIILLTGFLIGTLIGTVSGAFGLMDPIAALLILAIIELALRVRRYLYLYPEQRLALHMLDTFRIGLLYGLLLEGFKLI
uniref:DUF565 domain-containing protein n=1 Tax=Paulinella chromatophora TaxID=39717 RepID=B1X4V2_PAUCH|nr:hypothetical protein PCC_0539 [Paulinella chromatophora]ACB42971.1 hypothetical protein PCC_0539 [Paulinella chromatophora]